MRLVTLAGGARQRVGAMIGESILDLSACKFAPPALAVSAQSMRAFIEAGADAIGQARRAIDQVLGDQALFETLRSAGAILSVADAKHAAPSPDARIILSCGGNYRRHIEEMGGQTPSAPVAFLKNPRAVIGPGDAIQLPQRHPSMVDWEAEFSAVIGQPCRNVPAERALDYVFGYTMINDVSARDWAAPLVNPATSAREAVKAWEDNIHGKQFPTFCPMGPCVALKDEIVDPASVSVWLKVNGETMQSANTDDLVFSLNELIAYFSRIYALMPGDIVTTGSPGGVGMGRKPPVFLKPGDVVELGAEGVGAMTNPVQSAHEA